jgi:Spy/CpxP family protein refolding chaperone
MRKKNLLFVVQIFALFLTSAFAARAQQQQQGAPKIPNGSSAAAKPQQIPKSPDLLQMLNLTPEQVKQIREINRDTREVLRANRQRVAAARAALDAAIYAENPATDDVAQRTRELSDAQAELLRTNTDREFRIRQVLTNEQLARFLELQRQAKIKRQAIQQRINQMLVNKMIQ